MRKFLITATLLLVAVTSLQIWFTQDQTPQNSPIDPSAGTGQAQIGGDFDLIDQNGKTVRASDLHGYVLLVYFGFTRCPDMCPLGLTTLTKTMELLGDKASHVIPVFISVDPEYDTPVVMKDYLTHFDKRMIGLTGTPEQVKQAEEAYKVYAARKQTHGKSDYTVDHSSYIYVMGKDGAFLTILPSSSHEQEIVHALEPYLGQ